MGKEVPTPHGVQTWRGDSRLEGSVLLAKRSEALTSIVSSLVRMSAEPRLAGMMVVRTEEHIAHATGSSLDH